MRHALVTHQLKRIYRIRFKYEEQIKPKIRCNRFEKCIHPNKIDGLSFKCGCTSIPAGWQGKHVVQCGSGE